MRGSIRLLAALTIVGLLGGCAVIVESDAVRLCRSLIPAFNTGDKKIDVTRLAASRIEHGILVTVAYTAARGREAPVKRAISCILQRDAAKPAVLELTNLATEDGPLGDVRLHLIRRHWIASGLAAVSDPSPVMMAGPVPEVPRLVAETLQISVGSLTSLAIYALLAAAYALIYGLIGRINLAFGELAMVAGYGAFLGFGLMGTHAGAALAVLAGVAVGLWTSAIQGAALGRLVLGPLAGRPGQHILVATVGVSIFWSELVRLTQGSGNRWMAPLLSQPFGMARSGDYVVTVTPMGLLVPMIAAAALLATLLLLRRSRFGRAWRAYADDPLASGLLGIDPKRVLLSTMLLAACVAGLAGVLTAFVYGGVGHGGGLVIGLKALIAAVIGGIGSVRGAILGAVLLGMCETAWAVLLPIEYRDPAIFAALALLLAIKPEGLFGGDTR